MNHSTRPYKRALDLRYTFTGKPCAGGANEGSLKSIPHWEIHALAVLAAVRHVPTTSTGAVPALLAPTRSETASRVGPRRAATAATIQVPKAEPLPKTEASLATRPIPGLPAIGLHVLVLTNVLRSPGGSRTLVELLVAIVHSELADINRDFLPFGVPCVLPTKVEVVASAKAQVRRATVREATSRPITAALVARSRAMVQGGSTLASSTAAAMGQARTSTEATQAILRTGSIPVVTRPTSPTTSSLTD